MKFLIDECLSPDLAVTARQLGFPESMHVNWIGLRSQPDWKLVQRAVNDGYVLVINNTTDFTALMKRQSGHPGLTAPERAASDSAILRPEAQQSRRRPHAGTPETIASPFPRAVRRPTLDRPRTSAWHSNPEPDRNLP